MAPPRQRTAIVQDDSRSEASSTTREHKAAAAKGRKTANGVVNTTSSSTRESKTSTNVANVTSAPAPQGESSDNLPKMPWSEMPLEFLHSYRHAYKLTSPSAFSTEYAHNLLSQGIGLRSPTAIAAQRAHLSRQEQAPKTNGSSTTPKTPLHYHRYHRTYAGPNGTVGRTQDRSHNHSKGANVLDGKSALNHIIGQDRVGKNQLALAVRKHFNSAGLVEQEAIARFLYKVREEGRGRHFRLKFQP